MSLYYPEVVRDLVAVGPSPIKLSPSLSTTEGSVCPRGQHPEVVRGLVAISTSSLQMALC